ncbi:uncharacterized protein [Primulina eburnea]|uniref:uncharacterized protein n=1 Tax=Primulina eburnea TaxID=1245227 RepID=UPI003C6C6D26
MGRELQIQQPFSLPPPPLPPIPPPSTSRDDPHHPSSSDAPEQPTSHFDASRSNCLYIYYVFVIGIIRRKALIKDLAALYHSECLTYCQELLELQKKIDEPFTDLKVPENSRKDVSRPPKRLKKNR